MKTEIFAIKHWDRRKLTCRRKSSRTNSVDRRNSGPFKLTPDSSLAIEAYCRRQNNMARINGFWPPFAYYSAAEVKAATY